MRESGSLQLRTDDLSRHRGLVYLETTKRRKRARIRAESEREKEPCHACALRTRCSHTCGCLNWQTTGTVTEVSPVLCHHERMLIPIADRVGRILYRERNPLFLHKHYNASWSVLSLLEDVAV